MVIEAPADENLDPVRRSHLASPYSSAIVASGHFSTSSSNSSYMGFPNQNPVRHVERREFYDDKLPVPSTANLNNSISNPDPASSSERSATPYAPDLSKYNFFQSGDLGFLSNSNFPLSFDANCSGSVNTTGSQRPSSVSSYGSADSGASYPPLAKRKGKKVVRMRYSEFKSQSTDNAHQEHVRNTIVSLEARYRRDVVKQTDGKFHCPLYDCKEQVRAFDRKCEWNKHMEKHDRHYQCPRKECKNLPGFTSSGGLLRHEREVHRKHGGPRNTVNCPYPHCKRHTGKGFLRQENLNEHLRRFHANPPAETAQFPEDNDRETSGIKRKRGSSVQGTEELTELREELKRVREENEKLKVEMDQQSQHALAMMGQIAELQDALRHSLG